MSDWQDEARKQSEQRDWQTKHSQQLAQQAQRLREMAEIQQDAGLVHHSTTNPKPETGRGIFLSLLLVWVFVALVMVITLGLFYLLW